MSYTGTIHIVYDGMWGSCGKGKFCGELALDKALNISVCVNNNAPNAGHSFVFKDSEFVFDNGEKVVTRHLPIGVVNPDIKYLVIGQGAAIDPIILKEELDKYAHLLNGRKIYIADCAAVVEEEDKEYEKSHQKTGSTNKGSGAALVKKIMRKSGLALNNPILKELQAQGKIEFVDDKTFFPTIYKGMNGFKGNENILVEGSQGDALGINGNSYPYTTSRDCNPAEYIKYIHAERYTANVKRYCVFRPFPIRINNISTTGDYIYTGDFQGAEETTWKSICEMAGLDYERIEQEEQTTVTHKLRRVAEFCYAQFAEMLLDTQPDECFLNFARYINGKLENLTPADVKHIQTTYANQQFINESNEDYLIDICEKNLALEQLLDYIETIQNEFNSMAGDLNLNITRVGTGAKSNQTLTVKNGITNVSQTNFARRARLNPLDRADKNNLPNIFKP